ncbi:MAG: hypothetical protein GX421_06240 [Caldisericales bacterium]|nr:hypothetical protein [Caldisericales bacterium]
MGVDVYTLIIAVSALVTAIATFYLFRETINLRKADVQFRVNDYMDSITESRHRLYDFKKNHNEWTLKERKIADEIGLKLQRIAFLCEHKYIDAETVMDDNAGVFVQSWDIIADYVRYKRDIWGEPRDASDGAWSRRHLEWFADKCKKYFENYKKQRNINVVIMEIAFFHICYNKSKRKFGIEILYPFNRQCNFFEWLFKWLI